MQEKGDMKPGKFSNGRCMASMRNDFGVVAHCKDFVKKDLKKIILGMLFL